MSPPFVLPFHPPSSVPLRPFCCAPSPSPTCSWTSSSTLSSADPPIVSCCPTVPLFVPAIVLSSTERKSGGPWNCLSFTVLILAFLSCNTDYPKFRLYSDFVAGAVVHSLLPQLLALTFGEFMALRLLLLWHCSPSQSPHCATVARAAAERARRELREWLELHALGGGERVETLVEHTVPLIRVRKAKHPRETPMFGCAKAKMENFSNSLKFWT